MAQIIPLSSNPNQSFSLSVSVDNKVLSLFIRLRYNAVANYWVMSISNSQGVLILDSVAFVTGNVPTGNILKQWKYLQIGSAYILNISGVQSPDFPNSQDLGTDFALLWSDTPA